MPRLRVRAEEGSLSENVPTQVSRFRPWAYDAAAAVVLVLLNVLLYRKVTRLWWTFDDANNLRLILTHAFSQTFTSAEVWPQQLFTPLMMVAFDAELAAFGLEPFHWYIVHLAIACVASIAVYTAMRLFITLSASLAGAATYAAAVPLCSVVTQLSTVHYLLAIILSSLSFIAFVVAVRRATLLLSLTSALLFLGALLAKEVAVLLPLLLIAVPVGNLRSRLRLAVAHGLALLVYFAWRFQVLGTFGGAYGWVIESSEWPRLIALLPWRLATAWAGVNLAVGLFVIVLMLAVIAASIRGRRALLLLAVGAIVAVAPILPVAKEVNRRYAVVPWLAVSVAFAVAAAGLKNRRAAHAAMLVVPLMTVVANRQEWGHEFGVRQRMSDEARFLFDMPPNGLLRRPATPPAVLRELNWVKTIHLKKPGGASWFFDDFYLCANEVGRKRVWEYDTGRRMLSEVTARIPALRQRHCSSINRSAPLTTEFRYREPALYWNLGPYATGRYSALLGNGLEAFEIPRRDALNLPGASGVALRIRYDSPEGWTTYSPELTLDFSKKPRWVWKR